jgi:hypothetical protein
MFDIMDDVDVKGDNFWGRSQKSIRFLIIQSFQQSTDSQTSRMASSGMLRHVALVRTDVSEALSSFETSVLTIATGRNTPEDPILHSQRPANFKSWRNIPEDIILYITNFKFADIVINK